MLIQLLENGSSDDRKRVYGARHLRFPVHAADDAPANHAAHQQDCVAAMVMQNLLMVLPHNKCCRSLLVLLCSLYAFLSLNPISAFITVSDPANKEEMLSVIPVCWRPSRMILCLSVPNSSGLRTWPAKWRYWEISDAVVNINTVGSLWRRVWLFSKHLMRLCNRGINGSRRTAAGARCRIINSLSEETSRAIVFFLVITLVISD